MNTKDMLGLLELLGWVVSRDDVGDYSLRYTLSDRVVSLVPTIRTLREEQTLSAMLSVSTNSFIEACSFIRGQNKRYSTLISATKGLKYNSQTISEAHVRQLSEEALAWAKEQDIESALVDYSNLPTSSTGALPIRHLSALALLQRLEKLNFYQESFKSGDRLEFVPYVTQNIIDRSVLFAEQWGNK